MAGAYARANGKFVEFQPQETPYELHQKEYYDLVTIPKYAKKPRPFGPYTVITADDQDFVVLMKAGEPIVAKSGFHMLSSEYTVESVLPRRTITVQMDNISFRTRDGVKMSVKLALSWRIQDPVLVHKFKGGFPAVETLLVRWSQDNMCKICRSHTRHQLLPTVDPEHVEQAQNGEEAVEKKL